MMQTEVDLRKHSAIHRWLKDAPVPWFVLYAGSAAFLTYFCMYAFRKPVSVATFADIEAWGFQLDYKSALLIAQVIGYAASKWIGVKVISEMTANWRAATILGLIVLAELALVLFALVPAPYNVLMLLLNGLPLGMIWGLVFSYLEGRKTSEILGAILAASFIVSSGMVKTVSKYLMLEWGVTEFWMPAVTGALFILPLFISVYFLALIPAPDASDHTERSERAPMNAKARLLFLKEYGPGLAILVAAYVLLTAFRDFRDNFAAEVWITLGYGNVPEIFTVADAPTALIVLLVLGATIVIRNNKQAVKIYHLIVMAGAALVGLATLAFQNGLIGGVAWMMLLSIGLYLAYVPFNCILFDRLMAAAKNVGNAGFMIYVADASGYLGSVALLLYKSFAAPTIDWLPFLEWSAYITSIGGLGLMTLSLVYFSITLNKKYPATVGFHY